MPIYEYRCENPLCYSDEICDVEHPISYKDGVYCSECDKDMEKLISAPSMIVIQHDPKTLDQQAERNTKKMGHYEKQMREKHYQEHKHVRKPKKWYQADAETNSKIKKMTKKQKDKYIMEGR